MFKKVIIVFFSSIWALSLGLFTYRLVEPATAEDSIALYAVNSNTEDPTATISTQESTSEMHYYLFCTVDNQDCSYLNTYILKNLATEMEVEAFSFLEYIDVEELYSDWTPSKLKSNFGFDNYPALVAIRNVGKDTMIVSYLQWEKDIPLDTDSVRDWFIELGLWTGPIVEKPDTIDKPLD